MRYYLYLSDTKVDMLYGQIPPRLRDKVATELKIDLKVLSTTFSESPADPNRYARLDVLTNYIERHEPVGTVDQPARFFKATMPLHWAFGDEDITRVGPYITFFTGSTPETTLMLGGARKHVVGEAPAKVDILPYVPSSMTLQFFIKELLMDEAAKEAFSDSGKRVDSYTELDILAMVAGVARSISSPAQTMEFLAKRVLAGPVAGRTVLLGSPIYVALAD